jgi:hypothetical protein
MSALPPKADIPRRLLGVRFGPIGDMLAISILRDLLLDDDRECESKRRALADL